jgi:hypothetical protein
MANPRSLHDHAPAAWLVLFRSHAPGRASSLASFAAPWVLACDDNNDRLSVPPRADRVLAWLAIALIYLLARWLYAAFRPTERRATRRG